MERPTLYHEIIKPSKEILQAIMSGLNQIFFPEEPENTGAAPMLDRELYGQGTLFDDNGIHRDSTARGDDW